MKKITTYFAAVTTLFVLTSQSASAQYTGLAGSDATGAGMGTFFKGVLNFIDNILLPLILGLAFLMFVWGVFKFFILGGSDEEAQQKGRSLMLYAVAGFVLILSFYGIVSVLTNGLGFGNQHTLPGAQEVKTGFQVKK